MIVLINFLGLFNGLLMELSHQVNIFPIILHCITVCYFIVAKRINLNNNVFHTRVVLIYKYLHFLSILINKYKYCKLILKNVI